MTYRVEFVDSIPPDALADGFDRTEASGWGVLDGATASMRPRWGFDTGAGSNYVVASGTGRISMSAIGTAYVMLVSTRVIEFDQTVTITVPAVATGGPIYLSLYGLYVTTDQNYKAELVFGTAGTVDIRIRKTITTASNLASASTGLTYASADRFKLRFQYTSGSTWRAKVWPVADPEPAAWAVTGTDTPTLGFGRCGVSAVADATNTNTLPLLCEFDDYTCTPSPAVRLDLMGRAPWDVLYEGTDMSPPPLRRAVASTLLRDGAVYPASAYDDRVLRLRLAMHADTPDEAADATLALAREVDRPTNFLRWQPTDLTHPVYFRTIRSDITRITEHPGTPGSFRIVEVELLAEPFAIGSQQILAPVAVGNDPASGSNRQSFDLTGILGDVDTPVTLRFDAADIDGQQSLIAVRRRSLDGLFYQLQLEDGTNQTDTTEPGNDAAMSGSANNYTRTTFATNAAMVNRVTYSQFPSSPFLTTAYRGKYRVWLRYRKSVAGDVIRARLMWAGFSTSDAIVGQTVTLASTTDRRYADLGVVSLPSGADPRTEGYSGLLWPASGASLAVQAERVSGSGNLDMDVLVFVPCDDRACYVSWPSSLTGYGVLDGVKEMAYEQSTDTPGTGPGPIGDSLGIPVAGTFPMLSPGVTNRIYVLPNIGTTGSQDSITDSVDVTAVYWPRYLYVRPPSS